MGSRRQPMSSLSEDHAAIRLQCVGRMFLSRREIKRLRKDCEEEERWRQALQRRRARIERLERELRHVEELPASEIGKIHLRCALRSEQQARVGSDDSGGMASWAAGQAPAAAHGRDPREGCAQASRLLSAPSE